MPTTKTTKKPAPKKPAVAKKGKAPAERMTLAETMKELEKAGSEQTRKTYRRHGAVEPLFGVSFATLKTLVKRIKVDHELALQLWDTGNFDARNLAVKVVDPALMTPGRLDQWAREQPSARMCCGYVGMVAAEGPHAQAKLQQWTASRDARERICSWPLLSHLAARDETTPDAYFLARLAEIEKTIHAAPNSERDGMNYALIVIGTRNAALRKAALAAAKRIGKVEVDHGDTECKTPDAAAYIEKTWAHSTSKGFESPAAHERSRESMRTRC
jgi:3-methyladenine DNA glycosylase AlkD